MNSNICIIDDIIENVKTVFLKNEKFFLLRIYTDVSLHKGANFPLLGFIFLINISNSSTAK